MKRFERCWLSALFFLIVATYNILIDNELLWQINGCVAIVFMLLGNYFHEKDCDKCRKPRPLKTKLLKKLRRRFVWKWHTFSTPNYTKSVWRVYDKVSLSEVGAYDNFDGLAYRMLYIIGKSYLYEPNITRQKRRWSDAKKQQMIENFKNNKL